MKNDHNFMDWHILFAALIRILISKIHQFGEKKNMQSKVFTFSSRTTAHSCDTVS